MIAITWEPGRGSRAAALFEKACSAYARLKGLQRTDEVCGEGFRIARLAASQSPWPRIGRVSPVSAATAGWWFDPQAAGAPDIEAFARSYVQENDRLLDRLQGQYVAVVGDAVTGELTVAGDRMGWFPCYLADRDGIAWASTSAMAVATAVGAALDVDALRGLFMGNPIRSPRSAFAGIRRLAVGERVTLTRGRSRVSRVWLPFLVPRAYRDIEEAIEEGLALLERSCVRIRQAWPRWVCDLTSGLDSRLAAAAMARSGGPVNVTVNGPLTHVDVFIAREIAASMGWSLHHFDLPPDWATRRWEYFQRGISLADGELPGQAIDGTLFVKLALRQSFDAAVGGGAGALLRDFFWQQEFLKIGRTKSLDIRRLMRYRFFFSSRPRMSLFRRDWRENYAMDQLEVASRIVALAPDALNTQKLDAIEVWKESGHSGRYAGAIFPVLAAPVPLMTPELLEYALGLPWRFRIRGRISREMTTRLNRRLAEMPTWYGGSAEPLRLTNQRQYLPYLVGSAKRLVRKLGQVTIGHPIFPDPTSRRADPDAHRAFVGVLEREGLLTVENLRTASLYEVGGLRRFMAEVRKPSFDAFDQLYVVVSVEVLCRQCEIAPPVESL